MRKYMETLRARGELLEVTREVDPKHELAAVTSAAALRRWGKPIVFHKVKGTKLPVLTNIYGSRKRLAEILGIGPNDFCRKWNELNSVAESRDAPLRPAENPPTDLVECNGRARPVWIAYTYPHCRFRLGHFGIASARDRFQWSRRFLAGRRSTVTTNPIVRRTEPMEWRIRAQ